MTAEIWNTYELAVAATTGGLIVGVATVGLMVLKRLDGARELATAKGWWEKAIKVQEANDRARWAPAYSENLFAIEPADVEPLDATILHVKYPTQELRLVADDPQVAAGLSRLADEVGLVQALSECETADQGFLYDTPPALSDRPAADELCESCGKPWRECAEDTDRPFLAQLIAAVTIFGWGFILRSWWRSLPWVERWADFRQSRRERNDVGSGEQATSADPFAELLAHVEAKPIVLDPDDEAALQAEHKAWKAANPPTNHGPDGQRHWNDVTAMHDIVTPGRHAKMPINASIPTQRTDGE